MCDLLTLGGEKSYKETCACALVSLSDFSPPSVYKSHILNRTMNKLYVFYAILTRIMNYFSYSPLNTSFISEKLERLPENPDFAEMRHCDVILTLQ